MPHSPIHVLKFGGVAVGSADAIRAAAAHVKRAAPQAAAVVSAANGVTDLLLEAGQAALRGDRIASLTAAKRFEARHDELIRDLFGGRGGSPPPIVEELRSMIADAAHEMRSMCESVCVLRELTPRAQDALVARGERVLARMFTAFLKEYGVSNLDFRTVIVFEHLRIHPKT